MTLKVNIHSVVQKENLIPQCLHQSREWLIGWIQSVTWHMNRKWFACYETMKERNLQAFINLENNQMIWISRKYWGNSASYIKAAHPVLYLCLRIFRFPDTIRVRHHILFVFNSCVISDIYIFLYTRKHTYSKNTTNDAEKILSRSSFQKSSECP